MSYVTILWSVVAATALLLAMVHTCVRVYDPRAHPSVSFAMVALAVVGVAITELGMMYSQTPQAWGEWVRWCHLPLFFLFSGTVLFVHHYLGTGRPWLMWTVIACRFAIMIANFSTYPNFNFVRIDAIGQVPLLGERVSVVTQAVPSSWQWFAIFTCLLCLGFVLDASLTCWRGGTHEQRRKAAVVGGGAFLFAAVAVVYTQLVIWGVARLPMLITPAFIVVLLAMAVELNRDLLRATRVAREFDQKQAQEEADKLRLELAHAGRVTMAGQLASSLAHELRQPLGAILRNAEAAGMLLEDECPNLDEIRAIIADIHADDRRAGEVIDRLRALLKRQRMEFQPVAMGTLLQEVSSLVRFDAAARHVTLQLAIGSPLPPVSGDRVHLSQVLINLIINGMDAIVESTATARRVIVEANIVQNHTVVVAVTDSGAGIRPESLERIFEPFFTTKEGGMGLGLCISRTIIEAHGGRLWAENGAQGGARFSIALPASKEACS